MERYTAVPLPAQYDAGRLASEFRRVQRAIPYVARALVFDVTDPRYGAVGDGVHDDTDAVQEALTDAVAANGVCYFPPGDYPCDTLTIAGSVVVRGAGRWLTTITHTATSHGFLGTATGGSSIVFEDFTLAGPTGLSPDNTKVGINWTTDSTSSRLCVARVDITGTFELCIQKSGGGILLLEDCSFRSTDVGVGVFQSADTFDPGFLYCEGCDFATPDGDLTSLGSVGIYIHPHIPFLVTNCHFHEIGRYGVYQNGNVTQARRVSVIVGCRFTACGITQAKNHGPTLVSGCTQEGISGKGSLVDGEVTFAGCQFKDVQYVSEPYNLSESRIRYLGCTFLNSGVQVGGVSGTRYKFSGCDFYLSGTSPTNSGICLYVTSAGLYVEVDGCTIEDDSTTFATLAALLVSGASDLRVHRLRTLGVRASSAGYGVVYFAAAPTRAEFNDCEFDVGSAGNTIALRMVAGVTADTVAGRNNRFVGTSVFHASSLQQRLVRRPGVGTAIASAATIDMNTADRLSHDTFVVTGSTTINTLSNPYPCVGVVRLVVGSGATWATGNAGNITPLTTGARTAGTVVTLLWEPTAAKWLEV